MKCDDLDSLMARNEGNSLPDVAIKHLRKCNRCVTEHQLSNLLSTFSSMNLEVDDSAPGEDQFLNTLQLLGETQSDPYERAQFLHDTVHRGDRLFWRGDYGQASRLYREALMVVQDEQGRAALQNKLARAQIHRHKDSEANELLSQALLTLGEPTPPQSMVQLAIWKEEAKYWAVRLRYYLAEQWPQLFPLGTKFGDRSRAAQHLYRELSLLAQNSSPDLSQWAHWKELQWAEKLQQPLEQIVSFGRRAVACALQQQNLRAMYWLHRVNKIPSQDDPIIQASAFFYIGRCAYILGRWDKARSHLERCVELSQSARDAYLRDAALQHLIRVYRNDGNFSEALRVAGQLLTLSHRLGNLPRVSASCRHFALIYAAYGDLRRAKQWAEKALKVSEQHPNTSQEQSLSQLRCYVLLGDIEFRCGRKESARLYIGEAIRLQRGHQLPVVYLRDGLALLRKILGEKQPKTKISLWNRMMRWLSSRWAVMRGDLERAHHLQTKALRDSSQEQQIPSDLAYLYQEYTGEERAGGLREAIPASPFAQDFLAGKVTVQSEQPAFDREADQLASMFPVGAVSSRWGRGALARDRSGAITAQLSNGADTPWGYFFADDIS